MHTPSYETETQVREQVRSALREKQRTSKGDVDEAKVAADLADPRYEAWVQDRIADARRAQRLVTEQQMADLRARRTLAEGDRARYIGPTADERSQATGQVVPRPQGQTGTITRVERRTMSVLYTFRPDVDPVLKVRAQTEDVELLDLTTLDWTVLERIP